ncbi:outer membrane protein assembly factor BamB family protein [Streptomyces chryseus]|uniref:Pyrrolo-quinoline quinone repeat domain-containing protein n=1 Tax=Streptomyces chryseus TaxID=68186 RepID=A0ABQ3DWF4_9ACTN|nr:PQQ-binding-like beta-propeller repeat protein [Streptomyces chryseus]GHB18423.1 hypothetical protein GCM10010346_48010 [Streptomyces chryseus]
MSQPPNQPPQGGFGAPQDPRQQPPQPPAQPPQAPPAPPAAPPQQPPAQPGYGYPQAPQQAPQQGYGYPGQPGQQPGQAGPYGQQPGPYGQQPGPYGQQPGPYGQQQPGPYGGYPGAPAPGGSGGGGFKGKPAVIIGAALAAALVVGGGIYIATSGDDGGKKKRPVAGGTHDNKGGLPTGDTDTGGDPAGDRDAGDDLNAGRQSGESKVLWLQKNDVDLPRNGSDVYGPWFTDGLVVKAMYKKVAAYNTTDGKEKWSLPLSTEICAAPVRAADDGKIVIGVKNGTTDKAKCSELQMVDLKTGKAGWKAEVKKEGAFDLLSDITIAISGNTVTAGRTGHSTAFSMKDGKVLWGKLPGECQPYAFTSSAKLISAAACSTGEAARNHERIQEHDPATGKVKWSYPLAKGWQVDKVYSVSPLVVSVQEREKKTWSVIALTDKGKLRAEIDGGKDKFQPRCGGTFVIFGRNLEGCTGVAADANSFYMATAEKTSGLERSNEVVAFDLDTGKPKWRSEGERAMMPLKMEGGDVLVHMEASYDKGGALATIAPSGGKPKTLLQNPQSTAEIENGFFSTKVAYEDGRLYVVASRVSATNDEEEKETKTMMVFGK